MLDTFQHALEHDRTHQTVAQQQVSAVVKAVNSGLVVSVGIGDIPRNSAAVKGFGNMELNVPCPFRKSLIALCAELFLYLQHITSPCRWHF